LREERDGKRQNEGQETYDWSFHKLSWVRIATCSVFMPNTS
jgi:hypothetical protein